MSNILDKLDIIASGFVLAVVIASLILWRWNKDEENPFNLTDLLMENNRASKLAVTWMGSFTVMSYGFVDGVYNGTLTDSYALLYAGTWVGGLVAKMFAPSKEVK